MNCMTDRAQLQRDAPVDMSVSTTQQSTSDIRNTWIKQQYWY